MNSTATLTSPESRCTEGELMHILLVEDDAHTADYAARGFKEAGHVVDVLEDGKDAMIQCLQTEYDVLVVDRMLPGMDGLAMVKSCG